MKHDAGVSWELGGRVWITMNEYAGWAEDVDEWVEKMQEALLPRGVVTVHVWAQWGKGMESVVKDDVSLDEADTLVRAKFAVDKLRDMFL